MTIFDAVLCNGCASKSNSALECDGAAAFICTPRNVLSQVHFLASTLQAIGPLFVQWSLWFTRIQNPILALSVALAVCLGMKANLAEAETVVRYGISLADIPLTTGQPDRGAGAYQFTAYTIYDPLVAWEMDVADRPGKLVPGLATEWKVDDKDKTKWRFSLRKGVKFHDGSDFNADAVIWNLDKVLNDKAPQFDKRQSAQVKTRLPSVASYAKIDDDTIEITTKRVDSFFPYQMLWFLVSSPAQYEKLGKDWDKFASQPSGTGPFKLTKLVPRELAELSKNPDYWDKKRIPKVDKLIGPGSSYVSAAKRLLYGTVDVGLPAGPSESIILTDDSVDPRLAALDLLVEAEHGPESAAILVTPRQARWDSSGHYSKTDTPAMVRCRTCQTLSWTGLPSLIFGMTMITAPTMETRPIPKRKCHCRYCKNTFPFIL